MSDFQDLQPYREQFPVTRSYAYLNHAALCPISTRVTARIQAHLDEVVQHGLGRVDAWEARLEEVRAASARLVGAQPTEVAFVRNTSHGLSIVATGLDWRAGENVLCATSEEYPSNVYPWQRLASRGVELRSVPAPEGRVEVEAFAAAGNEATRLVAVSSVQYASGFRVDLEGLGRLCQERGWLLCVDGIQSLGAIPIDVRKLGIHFLSADSHKWMLGLPGIGVFYVAQELACHLEPPLLGWRSMQGAFNFNQAKLELREDALRFEEGNLPYSLIDGMGASVEMMLEIGPQRIWQRIQTLNDHLIARLDAAGHKVTSTRDPLHRSGSVTFQPRDGDLEGLVARLTQNQVAISNRRGQVRVSAHFYNVEAELDRLVAAAG